MSPRQDTHSPLVGLTWSSMWRNCQGQAVLYRKGLRSNLLSSGL